MSKLFHNSFKKRYEIPQLDMDVSIQTINQQKLYLTEELEYYYKKLLKSLRVDLG